jgi:hypothetical protein
VPISYTYDDPAVLKEVVVKPRWLYAHIIPRPKGFFQLCVYKSPVVRDTDPVYAPVAALLAVSDSVEMLSTEKVSDSDMWSGTAELTSYLLEIAEELVA